MQRAPRGDIWQALLGTLAGVIFIFAVAMLAVGQNLKNDSGNVPAVAGFVPTTCTLTAVTIVPCSPLGYAAVWKRSENGVSAIEDPFAFSPSLDMASRAANNYPLNTTIPCMCTTSVALETSMQYPKAVCGGASGGRIEDNPCMLNVKEILYMQRVGGVYGYSAPTLLAIGALLLVVAVAMVVFLCIGNGYCACCGGPKPTDAFAKMSD